jgi:Zn-finger nucleic acid-binding protein/ribosomal protein L40E
VDAQVHRCGSCGALVRPEAETCDYCRSAIVRDQRKLNLICPECYARSADESHFCTGCGVEFRPQIPVTASEALTCPCCDCLMKVRGVGGVALYECGECLGLWVPGDNFDALIHRAAEAQRAEPSHGLSTAGKRAVQSSFSGKVVYRRCPVCSGTMQRKNYGRRSGVVIDWCGEDGTWLDADELEAIASFVLGGGLNRPASQPMQTDADRSMFRNAKLKQVEAIANTERMMEEAREEQHRRRSRTRPRSGLLGSIADLLEELID